MDISPDPQKRRRSPKCAICTILAEPYGAGVYSSSAVRRDEQEEGSEISMQSGRSLPVHSTFDVGQGEGVSFLTWERAERGGFGLQGSQAGRL